MTASSARRPSPKRQRLVFVGVTVLLCALAVQLALAAFRDNIIFFYTPAELLAKPELAGKRLRLGGLVEEGSAAQTPEGAHAFTLTDGEASIRVTFAGLLPSLFREGQGVVAEGALDEAGAFTATQVLAKHDERYVPKEVAERLKKSGHWHGAGGKP